MPKEIFEEAKFFKVVQQLSHSDGPVFTFSLLDRNKKELVADEVFYHWLEKQQAIFDQIAFAFVLGAVFIKGVVSGGNQADINVPETLLHSDGFNIKDFIGYCLTTHPEIIEKTADNFTRIFGKTIKFRKSSAVNSIDKNDILVQLNTENWFSIDKLSDGMNRALRILLQLASARTGDILVMDEPELHLHPGAARRLRNVLSSELPDIQIILSTHSPMFIDPQFSDMIVLNYTNCDTPSVLNSKNVDLALSEIGSRGLDVLLYDGIVWVEGKSDEIYMRHWLDLMNPTSGYQIGIQPYGGTGAIPYIDVKHIKSICRNSVFVVDGGLKSANDEIKEKPGLLNSQCEKNGIFCWVIMRNSIENCIPADVIETALHLQPRTLNVTKYDNIINVLKSHERNFEKRKVILAKALAPHIKIEHIKKDIELFNQLELLFSEIIEEE